MSPETIELLLRYESLLKLTYIPNPYFKSEYEYKESIRLKIKEIQLTSKNHNPLTFS